MYLHTHAHTYTVIAVVVRDSHAGERGKRIFLTGYLFIVSSFFSQWGFRSTFETISIPNHKGGVRRGLTHLVPSKKEGGKKRDRERERRKELVEKRDTEGKEGRSQRERSNVRKKVLPRRSAAGRLTVPGARTSAATARPRSRRSTVSCGIRRWIVAHRPRRPPPRRPRPPPSSRARRGSPAAS